MITSHPSAASTRAVAALTRGKNTDCTQPGEHADDRPPLPAGGDPLGEPPAAASAGRRAAPAAAPARPRGRPSRPGRSARSAGPPRSAAAAAAARSPPGAASGTGTARRSTPWSPGRGPSAARSPRRGPRPGRPGWSTPAAVGAGHHGAGRAVVAWRAGVRVRAVLRPFPRRLDDLVVLHPGRARGHARHAPEAAVEVLGRPPGSAAPRRAAGSPGRSAPAASPSPRPTARTSGRRAGRSRSARSP